MIIQIENFSQARAYSLNKIFDFKEDICTYKLAYKMLQIFTVCIMKVMVVIIIVTMKMMIVTMMMIIVTMMMVKIIVTRLRASDADDDYPLKFSIQGKAILFSLDKTDHCNVEWVSVQKHSGYSFYFNLSLEIGRYCFYRG